MFWAYGEESILTHHHLCAGSAVGSPKYVDVEIEAEGSGDD